MYTAIYAELINGSHLYSSRPHPWVARILGYDDKYIYKREFIKFSVYDYTYARRSGTRGIMVYWFLPTGLYEMYRPVSWNPKSDERFFFYAKDGEWHKLKEDAVICLLNADLASTS